MVVTVLFFSQDNCPMCPSAKTRVIDVCKRLKVGLDLINVKDIMGYKRAIEYNVLSTPSVIIEHSDTRRPHVRTTATNLEESLKSFI